VELLSCLNVLLLLRERYREQCRTLPQHDLKDSLVFPDDPHDSSATSVAASRRPGPCHHREVLRSKHDYSLHARTRFRMTVLHIELLFLLHKRIP
jgi:hypothetical protein